MLLLVSPSSRSVRGRDDRPENCPNRIVRIARVSDAGKFPRTALPPAGIAPKPLERAIAGFPTAAGCSWLLFAVVARGFFCLCCRKASVSAAEIKPLAVIFRYYSVISGGSINIAAAENS
jgi:hypothetical protein